MKRMIIILWAGSVLFGACSILRRSERVRTASSAIATVEARSGIRQDSMVASLGRVVRVDRRWEAVSQHTGMVYQYRERIRMDEEAHTVSSASVRETAVVHHQAQAETADYRHGKSRVDLLDTAWWWLAVCAVAVMSLVLRLFRFWPFK